jgi:hypothetical protein
MKRYTDESGRVRYDISALDFWATVSAVGRLCFKAGQEQFVVTKSGKKPQTSFWGLLPFVLDDINPELVTHYQADYPLEEEASRYHAD